MAAGTRVYISTLSLGEPVYPSKPRLSGCPGWEAIQGDDETWQGATRLGGEEYASLVGIINHSSRKKTMNSLAASYGRVH
jgi:hypothetical protein